MLMQKILQYLMKTYDDNEENYYTKYKINVKSNFVLKRWIISLDLIFGNRSFAPGRK